MHNIMRNLIRNAIIILGLGLTISTSNAQSYNNAVGLRAAWGVGGTFKHFLSEKVAAEAVLNYWNRGTLGFRYSRTRIMVLAQVHNDLAEVTEGLQWYVGGGAFVGFWGGNYSRYYEFKQTKIGLSGVLGLDYTFAELPINISIDWMPSLTLAEGEDFPPMRVVSPYVTHSDHLSYKVT